MGIRCINYGNRKKNHRQKLKVLRLSVAKKRNESAHSSPPHSSPPHEIQIEDEKTSKTNDSPLTVGTGAASNSTSSDNKTWEEEKNLRIAIAQIFKYSLDSPAKEHDTDTISQIMKILPYCWY